jgi:hypothetical protein
MKLAQVTVAALGTAALALAAPAQAFAAAPSNDTIGGATVISAVPFNETIDTSQATTDADDAAINAQCGAPATNGSVWYQLTAAESSSYLVDVSQSNFSAGVIVATGAPGQLGIVTCGPGSVAFSADPGATYFIMAFSDQTSVTGGQLTISVTAAPPPPQVSLTVNSRAVVTKQGTAIVSGTYTCSGQADFIEIFGNLDQPVGRFTVNGSFDTEVNQCDGTAHSWSAEAVAANGTFAGGKAASLSVIFGCNALGCNFYETQQNISLRGGSGR